MWSVETGTTCLFLLQLVVRIWHHISSLRSKLIIQIHGQWEVIRASFALIGMVLQTAFSLLCGLQWTLGVFSIWSWISIDYIMCYCWVTSKFCWEDEKLLLASIDQSYLKYQFRQSPVQVVTADPDVIPFSLSESFSCIGLSSWTGCEVANSEALSWIYQQRNNGVPHNSEHDWADQQYIQITSNARLACFVDAHVYAMVDSFFH